METTKLDILRRAADMVRGNYGWVDGVYYDDLGEAIDELIKESTANPEAETKPEPEVSPENCGRSNEDLECLGCGHKLGEIGHRRLSGELDYCPGRTAYRRTASREQDAEDIANQPPPIKVIRDPDRQSYRFERHRAFFTKSK